MLHIHVLVISQKIPCHGQHISELVRKQVLSPESVGPLKETLDKIKTLDPNALISSDGDIVKSLGEKTLLQTWQIKDGFGFNAVPQKIDLSGYTAYLLDDEKIGKYLYLLGEIEEKSIKELIRKIESLELTVDKIFIYGYSFDFNMLTSITTNLKTLKNRNPLEPIVRY